MPHEDILGLLAGALVLATFATSHMGRLRLLAILSNIAFLFYATALSLWPVLVLHGLLLPINAAMAVRLWRGRRSGGTVPRRTCPPPPPRHVRPQATAVRRSRPTRYTPQESPHH